MATNVHSCSEITEPTFAFFKNERKDLAGEDDVEINISQWLKLDSIDLASSSDGTWTPVGSEEETLKSSAEICSSDSEFSPFEHSCSDDSSEDDNHGASLDSSPLLLNHHHEAYCSPSTVILGEAVSFSSLPSSPTSPSSLPSSPISDFLPFLPSSSFPSVSSSGNESSQQPFQHGTSNPSGSHNHHFHHSHAHQIPSSQHSVCPSCPAPSMNPAYFVVPSSSAPSPYCPYSCCRPGAYSHHHHLQSQHSHHIPAQPYGSPSSSSHTYPVFPYYNTSTSPYTTNVSSSSLLVPSSTTADDSNRIHLGRTSPTNAPGCQLVSNSSVPLSPSALMILPPHHSTSSTSLNEVGPVRRVRQTRPKVVEAKGAKQCKGRNRKKGIQCRNAALMEYIGPRPEYCAEHIDLDPKSLYTKCKSPYQKEVGDNKGCKEVVLKEFGICYKHYGDFITDVIRNRESDKARTHFTRITELLIQLEREAAAAKKKDGDLYQRKNKLIPKFQEMKKLASKAIDTLMAASTTSSLLLSSSSSSLVIPGSPRSACSSPVSMLHQTSSALPSPSCSPPSSGMDSFYPFGSVVATETTSVLPSAGLVPPYPTTTATTLGHNQKSISNMSCPFDDFSSAVEINPHTLFLSPLATADNTFLSTVTPSTMTC